jgi:amino acid permease
MRFRTCYGTTDIREFTSLLTDADWLGSCISQSLFDQAAQLRRRRHSRLQWMSRRIVFRQTLVIALLLVPAGCLLLLGILAPQWLDVQSLMP